MAKLISPLAGKTDTYVKDSEHFMEVMKDVCIDSDEIMVSFDVSSLFTNVPIEEAIEVIHGMLHDDETLGDRTALLPGIISKLLETCLKSTYFCYRGEYFEQKEGAAMGSPVSSVVANLYMEFFEELALSTAPTRPRLWKRYVDDTFCVVKRGSEGVLLTHLKRTFNSRWS